jgi:mannosyltransferase OCH1-like enzyme
MVLVPLEVTAPAEPGEYMLEVDVVHERVRWFECAYRQPVSVVRPVSGKRLRETPVGAARVSAVAIPQVLHRVWLGARPLPEAAHRFGETFSRLHPGWDMRLWRDADLPGLGITAEDVRRSRSKSELSNLARYEILHRFGGVYADTDVECLRSFTPLLSGITGFAALELPGRVGTAVLGGVPGLRAFASAAAVARESLGVGTNSADANGPYLLSLVLEDEPDFTIYGAHVFYPTRWDRPVDTHNGYHDDSYAVHHWSGSWLEEEGLE